MRAVILHPRGRAKRFGDFRKTCAIVSAEAFSFCSNPSAARRDIGNAQSRAMPSVAAAVSDIRVRGRDGIYRTFYCTGSTQGILVFHAFVKQTAQTPAHDVSLARARLTELPDA